MTWTIILLVVGILLLVLEMFTPGLGAAGGLGVLALLGAVILQIGNPVGMLFMIALVLFIVAVALIVVMYIGNKGFFDKSKLVLKDSINAESTSLADDRAKSLLGKIGLAETALRPAGKVALSGAFVDVTTGGEFLKKGTSVEIIAVEGLRILVREKSFDGTEDISDVADEKTDIDKAHDYVADAGEAIDETQDFSEAYEED